MSKPCKESLLECPIYRARGRKQPWQHVQLLDALNISGHLYFPALQKFGLFCFESWIKEPEKSSGTQSLRRLTRVSCKDCYCHYSWHFVEYFWESHGFSHREANLWRINDVLKEAILIESFPLGGKGEAGAPRCHRSWVAPSNWTLCQGKSDTFPSPPTNLAIGWPELHGGIKERIKRELQLRVRGALSVTAARNEKRKYTAKQGGVLKALFLPLPSLSFSLSPPLINRSMWLTAWHMVCEAAWDGTLGVPCGHYHIRGPRALSRSSARRRPARSCPWFWSGAGLSRAWCRNGATRSCPWCWSGAAFRLAARARRLPRPPPRNTHSDVFFCWGCGTNGIKIISRP